MSSAIFPTLVGLAMTWKRAPVWNTKILESASGKESRTTFYSWPRYIYTGSYDVLIGQTASPGAATANGWAILNDFFNARSGAFDDFLLDDTDYNTETAQNFGTGTGAATQFQLVGSLGTDTEPIQDLNGAIQVFDNAVLVSGANYSVGATGIVTFTTPPVSGHALTWTGSFYRRVRFLQDTLEFEKFAKNFWLLKQIQLKSIKL
jgi:uncharacterized protein (TIGR02217 family)